jgi:SRSO17 transposase
LRARRFPSKASMRSGWRASGAAAWARSRIVKRGGAASASRQGYTRLDRRRSVPEAWFDAAHRERWHQCGVPEDTPFKTKPTLALEMLQAVVPAGTGRVPWVTCDEAFGREPTCPDGGAALPRWYDAERPHDTRVWLQRPATAVPAWGGPGPSAPPGPPGPWGASAATGRSARQDAAPRRVAPVSHHRRSARAFGGRVRLPPRGAVRAGWPGPDVWSVCRRAVGEQSDLKVDLSTAPAHTPVTLLVRVAGMRWPIETAFEESQGGLGLDHYAVRR